MTRIAILLSAVICLCTLSIAQTPTATFSILEAANVTQLVLPLDPTVSDFNKDGLDDFSLSNGFIALGGMPSVKVYINKGDKSFAEIDLFATFTGGLNVISEHFVGDFDGNGYSDIAVCFDDPVGLGVAIWTNDSAGFTSSPLTVSEPFTRAGLGSLTFKDPGVYDIDKDGMDELVVNVIETVLFSGPVSHGMFVVDYNPASGLSVTTNNFGDPAGVAIIADVDTDGYPEMLGADRSGMTYIVSNYNGMFLRQNNTGSPYPLQDVSCIAPIDLNGDQYTDFIMTYCDNGKTVAMENISGSSFIFHTYTIPNSIGTVDLNVSDIDADGRQEIILVSLYPNDIGKLCVYEYAMPFNLSMTQEIVLGAERVPPTSMNIGITGFRQVTRTIGLIDITCSGVKDIMFSSQALPNPDRLKTAFLYNINKSYVFEEYGYSNGDIRFYCDSGYPIIGMSAWTMKFSGLDPLQPYIMIVSNWELGNQVYGNVWLYPGMFMGDAWIPGLTDSSGIGSATFSLTECFPDQTAYVQVFAYNQFLPYQVESSHGLRVVPGIKFH